MEGGTPPRGLEARARTSAPPSTNLSALAVPSARRTAGGGPVWMLQQPAGACERRGPALSAAAAHATAAAYGAAHTSCSAHAHPACMDVDQRQMCGAWEPLGAAFAGAFAFPPLCSWEAAPPAVGLGFAVQEKGGGGPRAPAPSGRPSQPASQHAGRGGALGLNPWLGGMGPPLPFKPPRVRLNRRQPPCHPPQVRAAYYTASRPAAAPPPRRWPWATPLRRCGLRRLRSLSQPCGAASGR